MKYHWNDELLWANIILVFINHRIYKFLNIGVGKEIFDIEDLIFLLVDYRHASSINNDVALIIGVSIEKFDVTFLLVFGESDWWDGNTLFFGGSFF